MTTDIIYIVDKIRENHSTKFNCVEPYISLMESKLKRGSLDLKLIEKRFKEEEYLQFMANIFFGCVCITKEVSTIVPVKNLKKTIKINSWLQNLNEFGAESKQGDVYKGSFLGKEIVLKKPKSTTFLENTLKDYFNGICCVNNLRLECPMFAYTLGILTIDKIPKGTQSQKEIWLATEYINGRTLKEMFANKHFFFEDFLDVFAQLLIALEIGQQKYKFCHYDLHANNIMIVPLKNRYTCHLFMYDIKVKSKYMPVLIDFGMSSSCLDDNISIGQHQISKNGIFPYLFPGYDAYSFLLYCKEATTSSMFSKIEKLFNFYGNINNLDYVKTLKNNTGRQTPMFFLEYLRHNYSLSLKFKPRTVMTKTLMLKTPSVIMGDMFLSLEEKKILKQPFIPETDKGFVQYVLELSKHKLSSPGKVDKLKSEDCKRMISYDIKYLSKFLVATPSEEDLQCVINILFLIKQLRINKYRPYNDWVNKFEASDSYLWYKYNKPFIDRCKRLK